MKAITILMLIQYQILKCLLLDGLEKYCYPIKFLMSLNYFMLLLLLTFELQY